MIKAIKSKMLTYLFKDWVMNETDLETLQVSKQFISRNENIAITGHVPDIGIQVSLQPIRYNMNFESINIRHIKKWNYIITKWI